MLTGKVRPLQAGTQIGLASANCSIGYTANVNAFYGIITANHCIGIANVTGINVYQPSSDFIGTVTRVSPTIPFNGTTCNNSDRLTCMLVDAAFVTTRDL